MSSEDFKSFVVTDPDILDEGIDISGLRKTTDTSPLLLGDLEPGLRYDPTLQSSYSDLLQYFSGGLPMLPETPAVVPPATGGGGTGGGGQATVPGAINTLVTPSANTPEEQRLIDAGIGLQAAPGQPVVAPGEIPVTQAEMDAFNRRPVTPVSPPGQPIDPTGMLPQTSTPFMVPGALGVDPREKMDFVTEEDLADNTSLLQKLGLPADFDLKKAALEAGINLVAGVPVNLIARGLEAVLPEDNIKNTTKVARETGLLTGDTTVTQDKYGINTQSQFGNYDQYNIKQVDKLQNRLDELNPDVNPNSKYKTQEDYLKNTKRLRQELEDRNKYLDKRGLKDVGDVDSGRGSGLRPTVDDATGVNPFAGIDTGVGEFDTTPTTAPVTGITKPRTVLGKPGIEKFDDAETSIDMFDTTPVTGGAIPPGEKGGPGYIEPPMTLADDTINRMTDDVDLDLFDTTPVDTTPIATDRIEARSDISLADMPMTEFNELLSNNPDRAIDLIQSRTEGQEYLDDLEEIGKGDDYIGYTEQEKADIAAGIKTPEPGELIDFGIDSVLGDTTPIDEFSDEEFMVGDTSRAAPTGGDSGADSFFDSVDRSVTGTTKPGTKTEPTYQDAIMRGQTGGGSDSGDSSNGGGKIVCTMMNESYGFGSFRNKIWMKFHKDLSPEYQRGYHKLFLPLVKIAKKNMIVKKTLEHIAVHSTIDMRQSMRGKTHLLGRVYRKILLPLCYWVGKHG